MNIDLQVPIWTIDHVAAALHTSVDTAREYTYRTDFPAPKAPFARNLWSAECPFWIRGPDAQSESERRICCQRRSLVVVRRDRDGGDGSDGLLVEGPGFAGGHLHRGAISAHVLEAFENVPG